LALCTRRRRRAARAWLARCRAPLLPTSLLTSLAATVASGPPPDAATSAAPASPSQRRAGRCPPVLGASAASGDERRRQAQPQPQLLEKERASPLPGASRGNGRRSGWGKSS
jgi:hypothetical protein